MMYEKTHPSLFIMQVPYYYHYRWRIIPLILVLGMVLQQDCWIRNDRMHYGISSNSSTILIKLNNTTPSTEESRNNSLANAVTATDSPRIFNRTEESNNISSKLVTGTTFQSSRISFRIEPGPRTSLGAEKQPILPWTCTGIQEQETKDFLERWPLATEMRSAFNFTTSLRTNLKILVMGDSIGLQLSEYLQSLLRSNEWDYDNDDSINTNCTSASASNPTILQRGEQLRRQASIHVTSPLEQVYNTSLGAIAGWRMIGMFLRKNHGKRKANLGPGWRMQVVQKLRNYVSHATSNHLNETMFPQNVTVGEKGRNKKQLNYVPSGDFDVMIFRIPCPGWIPMEQVQPEQLQETIELAHEVFGVKVVIFTTLHYVNNILTHEQRTTLDQTNQQLIEFSRNWTTAHSNKNSTTGVHTVYVLDHGRLNDELFEWNARLLGFNTTNYTAINSTNSSVSNNSNGTVENDYDYIDTKLQTPKHGHRWKPQAWTVAQVCAKKVPHMSTDCIRNSITQDGMHPCYNTIGPRVVAGLACQLQCVSDWRCAQRCNDRFLTVTSNPLLEK